MGLRVGRSVSVRSRTAGPVEPVRTVFSFSIVAGIITIVSRVGGTPHATTVEEVREVAETDEDDEDDDVPLPAGITKAPDKEGIVDKRTQRRNLLIILIYK